MRKCGNEERQKGGKAGMRKGRNEGRKEGRKEGGNSKTFNLDNEIVTKIQL